MGDLIGPRANTRECNCNVEDLVVVEQKSPRPEECIMPEASILSKSHNARDLANAVMYMMEIPSSDMVGLINLQSDILISPKLLQMMHIAR